MKKSTPRIIAIDYEHDGLDPKTAVVWMLAITEGNSTKVYHDCNGMKKLPKEVVKLLADDKILKVIHNSNNDCPITELQFGIKMRNVWDTMLMETLVLGATWSTSKKGIEPGSYEDQMLRRWSNALRYTLPRYGFPEPDKSIRENFIGRPLGKPFTKKEIKYAEDDTKYLIKLQKYQEIVLTRDKQMEVALLENLVAERFHDMKVRGIGFDSKVWREIAALNKKEFDSRQAKLPKGINWNSPAQVKKYFISKGINLTSYEVLFETYLSTKNKTLGEFILARELHKSVTSYGLNWFDEGFVDDDGRIRCSTNQIINTGRTSKNNPNLQQLPGEGNEDFVKSTVMEMLYGKNDRLKPQHRRAFVPKPGHVFVIGDFSGQELGIMAAMADEKLWLNAMLRGEDVHMLTASLVQPNEWARGKERGCVFPKKCKCKEHVKLRKPAKVNNFLLAYGGGYLKLAKKTGMSEQMASIYVGGHKRVTPRLTAKLEANAREALATGVSYSADPYRRRRVLLGDEDWHIRNQGKNNPVQASGANLIKLAIASIPWDYAVLLDWHDEIILEIPKAKAMKAMRMLKSVMEQSADYITGVKGLIKVEPKAQLNLMKELPAVKDIKLLDAKHCYHL